MDPLEVIKALHQAGLTGPLLAGTVVAIITVLKLTDFISSLGDVLLKRKEAANEHELAMRELDVDIDYRKHQQAERATFLPHDQPRQITHVVVEPPPASDVSHPKRRTGARKG